MNKLNIHIVLLGETNTFLTFEQPFMEKLSFIFLPKGK